MGGDYQAEGGGIGKVDVWCVLRVILLTKESLYYCACMCEYKIETTKNEPISLYSILLCYTSAPASHTPLQSLSPTPTPSQLRYISTTSPPSIPPPIHPPQSLLNPSTSTLPTAAAPPTPPLSLRSPLHQTSDRLLMLEIKVSPILRWGRLRRRVG